MSMLLGLPEKFDFTFYCQHKQNSCLWRPSEGVFQKGPQCSHSSHLHETNQAVLSDREWRMHHTHQYPKCIPTSVPNRPDVTKASWRLVFRCKLRAAGWAFQRESIFKRYSTELGMLWGKCWAVTVPKHEGMNRNPANSDHPLQVCWCYPQGPSHTGEGPALKKSWELCTSPFPEACHPKLLPFPLLQDMLLHFEMSVLRKKLGRKAGGAGNEPFFLPCFGRSVP